MHKRTDLSTGNLNGADRLSVELIESPDMPPTGAIVWPPKATICTPAHLDAVVATAMRLLANAVVDWPQSGGGGSSRRLGRSEPLVASPLAPGVLSLGQRTQEART